MIADSSFWSEAAYPFIGLVLVAFFSWLGYRVAVVLCALADNKRDLTCPCGQRRLRGVVVEDARAEKALSKWLQTTCPDCSKFINLPQRGGNGALNGKPLNGKPLFSPLDIHNLFTPEDVMLSPEACTALSDVANLSGIRLVTEIVAASASLVRRRYGFPENKAVFLDRCQLLSKPTILQEDGNV